MMDRKTIAAAKAIPRQLKTVMEGLFEESRGALQSGISALRASLGRVEKSLADLEKDSPEETPAKASPAAGAAAPKRRKRRGKRFPIGEFVLAQLAQSPKPMRPIELAIKLGEATGRDKKSALSNINTLLLRLRKAKKVTSKNGLYRVAK